MADTRMLDRGELDASTHPDRKPPSFSCVEEERAHRKARLAGACRIFAPPLRRLPRHRLRADRAGDGPAPIRDWFANYAALLGM